MRMYRIEMIAFNVGATVTLLTLSNYANIESDNNFKILLSIYFSIGCMIICIRCNNINFIIYTKHT